MSYSHALENGIRLTFELTDADLQNADRPKCRIKLDP